jgi:hypothetical protein
MKTKSLWAIALIVFGVVSLSYAGIHYTRRETVLKVGSLVATADRQETIPLSPVVGGLCLVAGVVMLAL